MSLSTYRVRLTTGRADRSPGLTIAPTILVNNLTNAFLLVYTGLSDCKPGRRSRRSSQVLLDTAPTTSATHSPYSSSRSLKSPPRWAIRRRARSVARSDDGRERRRSREGRDARTPRDKERAASPTRDTRRSTSSWLRAPLR